jgi:hypothetical protein
MRPFSETLAKTSPFFQNYIMEQTYVEELIEQLERGDESLTSIALSLESAARALHAENAAALVRRELDGYPATGAASELEEAGRSNDVLGRMKLSGLESRLEREKEKASRTSSDPVQKLLQMQAAVAVQQLEQILEACRQFLLRIAHGLRSASQQQWVGSIHGILTRGAWQKDLVPLLSERNLHPWPIDYKWYDPLRMLFEGSRNKKIAEFTEKYGQFKQIHNVRPSIIAHSMGSYIVTRAIEANALEFDRVILCGCIARENYPWNEMVRLGRIRRVLHDYGRKDIWARLAPYFIDDAGQSGFRGFEQDGNGAVVQRKHTWFKHSDYFYATNFIERWIPFLQGNDPPEMPADEPSRINWRFRIVKWSFWTVVLGAIAWAVLKFV